MKLYWSPNTRAFRVAWLLEESGLKYERITVNLRDPTAKNEPAFRAVSPLGKVPALEDGPARLSDSGAICIYIADQYPQAQLGPAVGDPDRASFLQWVTYTNSVVEPSMAEKFAKLEPRPASYGWGSFDLMISALQGELSKKEWIMGARFSAADVLLGTSASWLIKFGLHPGGDAIAAYVDRCKARPAWQRAQAFDSI
jgi:glutathione S-transferase